jgi:hypothetical protein
MSKIRVGDIPAPHTARAQRPCGEGEWPCLLCCRPIKPGRGWWVHMVDGGEHLVSRDESPACDPNDPGDMGFHAVGPDCAKLVPREYLISHRSEG